MQRSLSSGSAIVCRATQDVSQVPSGEKLERSVDGHVHELEARPTTADLSLAVCSAVTFYAYDSLPELLSVCSCQL
eukprot:scaffold119119_cov23-Prasinocladus_malaysianus.AAC.1